MVAWFGGAHNLINHGVRISSGRAWSHRPHSANRIIGTVHDINIYSNHNLYIFFCYVIIVLISFKLHKAQHRISSDQLFCKFSFSYTHKILVFLQPLRHLLFVYRLVIQIQTILRLRAFRTVNKLKITTDTFLGSIMCHQERKLHYDKAEYRRHGSCSIAQQTKGFSGLCTNSWNFVDLQNTAQVLSKPPTSITVKRQLCICHAYKNK